MFDEVYILFHFNIILNTTGCPLLKLFFCERSLEFCITSLPCSFSYERNLLRIYVQVNCGNCGIPWVNCAVLCVKDDWKGQLWGLPALQNCTVYSVFMSGMMSHRKIAQFDRDCIGPLRRSCYEYILEVNHNVNSKWAIFGLCYNCIQVSDICIYTMYVNSSINTLRTGDADLRFQHGETRYICKFSLVSLHKGECFQRYHTLKHY